MTPSVAVTDASSDIGYVEALLERNRLPAEDVRDGGARFFLARVGSERVGVGGLEVDGVVALLRSVVIEEHARGNGYGAALCTELEARAVSEGVANLYLLTTTAPDFFARQGFARIERGDAPAAIRQTSEFAELCPDSAVLMRKTIRQ